MRRAAGIVAAAAALVAIPSAAAQDGHHGGHGAAPSGANVSVQFANVAPATVSILVGETVTWTNDSIRRHTVTGDDARWSSDTLLGGDQFRHRFDGAGSYGYYCRLHAGIRGTVDAHTVLLDAPRGPAAPGMTFPLTGRTVADAGDPIVIEEDAGEGFRRVATADAGADGRFAARVTPRTSARYRAVADGAESPAVQVLVLDHQVRTQVSAKRVRVSVTPLAPRGTVVLQARLRERFGWWPIATARLNARSEATFALRGRRVVRARVVYTLPDGATRLAAGASFRSRIPAG